MARYFFNVTDGAAVTVDGEGVELDGDAAAREAAINDARQLLCDGAKAGYDRLHWRVEVIANGRHLFDLPFTDAVVPGRLTSLAVV